MSSHQVTRCPHCQAVFRVTPESLAQAQGWLRCGACREVFDSTGLTVSWSSDPELGIERMDLQAFLKEKDPVGAPATPGLSDALLSFEKALTTFPGRLPEMPGHDPVLSPLDLPDLAGTPVPAALPSVGRRRSMRIWITGLLLLALLQLAWAYRSLWWQAPWAGQTAQMICARLGCQVPASRGPDLLIIDSSRFVRTDNGYRLEWTLRNPSNWPLRMASLELILTDAGGGVQVRRVIHPEQMAAPDRLEPRHRWDGVLALQMTDGLNLPVSGYHLLVFYP